MKRIVIFILLFAGGLSLKAQNNYLVWLKDKGSDVDVRLLSPKSFLGPDALKRRAQYKIPLAISDLPIESDYLVKIVQSGAQVNAQSKWLNVVWIQANPEQIEKISQLPFISTIQNYFPPKLQSAGYSITENTDEPFESEGLLDYGAANRQHSMLRLAALHDKGYTGKNIRITFCDAGFYKVDSMKSFDYLRSNKRLIAHYDFVAGDSNVFNDDGHGMRALSIAICNRPGELIGSGFDAEVILARTEDVFSETRAEEFNWIRAAEWADSIGTDIIHTSLGYSKFNPGQGDYLPSQMDGNTALITRAADIAASKGILVNNSAGNEGNDPKWRIITAPSDGDSVLCVGATDTLGNVSGFSGRGPSADGRVKPDVVCMGQRVALIGEDDTIRISSGTSFSAPIIAGMAACLMQAHPLRTNMEIIEAIRRSAHKYCKPDSLFGYGIPDAILADSVLTLMDLGMNPDINQCVLGDNPFIFYPNPVGNTLTFQAKENFNEAIDIYLYDLIGKQWIKAEGMRFRFRIIELNVSQLQSGIYLLHIPGYYTQKIIKQ